jgi:hypothetical protein
MVLWALFRQCIHHSWTLSSFCNIVSSSVGSPCCKIAISGNEIFNIGNVFEGLYFVSATQEICADYGLPARLFMAG